MIKLSFIIIIKTTYWQNIMIWAFDCKYCLTTLSWWVDYKLVESLLTRTAVQMISSPSIPKKMLHCQAYKSPGFKVSIMNRWSVSGDPHCAVHFAASHFPPPENITCKTMLAIAK
jgi:hypothetical protein